MRLTKRRTHINISPEFFTGYCKDAVEFKAIVFFYFCKSKYKNSQIYNYTPNKLSTLTGVSANTVRKYVGILKSLGLVEKKNKNLLFINPKRIMDFSQKKVSIDVLPWTTYKQFFGRILAELIRRNQMQQKWIASAKSASVDKNSNFASKDYKKYCKKYQHNYIGELTKIDYSIYQSSKQLAVMFNINQRTILNWIYNLENIGYIDVEHIIEKIDYNIPIKYIPYYSFTIDNNTFIHHGSKYSIKI